MKITSIEINNDFKKAIDLLENSAGHVFITGKAGTGKSTFLEYFRATTHKKVVVLAPTGVAALNVKGETIHSFFKFKLDTTLEKIKKRKGQGTDIYKKVEVIIIDEASMVRADLMDFVDRFLRLNRKNKKLPFGGVQMVFIGDLYQLSPVVTAREKELFNGYYKSPYFFDSKVFDTISLNFVEFEKVYRQHDDTFIGLLNAIRNNSVSDEELSLLNKRFGANFEREKSSFHINLTTTNDMASRINHEYLGRLTSEVMTFKAEVDGKFDARYYPTDAELHLRVGAQVMLLNNDSEGRWVNGSVGKIIDIHDDMVKDRMLVWVELSDGSIQAVEPHTWEIFHYTFDKKTNNLDTESVGNFIQYPLRLAWAVTIHKSQGKTFDNVVIDIGWGTFSPGQMYVALSRCTTLGGIVLKKPIQKKHIFLDYRVVRFITEFQYAISERNMPIQKKISIIEKAIKEKNALEITYLKANDIKSHRTIKPFFIGNKEYKNKSFLGVDAFCEKRNEERVFKVDRILNMKQVSPT